MFGLEQNLPKLTMEELNAQKAKVEQYLDLLEQELAQYYSIDPGAENKSLSESSEQQLAIWKEELQISIDQIAAPKKKKRKLNPYSML